MVSHTLWDRARHYTPAQNVWWKSQLVAHFTLHELAHSSSKAPSPRYGILPFHTGLVQWPGATSLQLPHWDFLVFPVLLCLWPMPVSGAWGCQVPSQSQCSFILRIPSTCSMTWFGTFYLISNISPVEGGIHSISSQHNFHNPNLRNLSVSVGMKIWKLLHFESPFFIAQWCDMAHFYIFYSLWNLCGLIFKVGAMKSTCTVKDSMFWSNAMFEKALYASIGDSIEVNSFVYHCISLLCIICGILWSL